MKRVLIGAVLATSLGGCVTVSQIDAKVASASDKLYDNCMLLQGAGILAAAVSDDDIVKTINDAIGLYCSSARVDSAVSAAKRVAEIYSLVSARLRK